MTTLPQPPRVPDSHKVPEREVPKLQLKNTVTSSGARVGRTPVLFDKDGLKPCSVCKQKLPKGAFSRNERMASGYSSQCKECFRAKGYSSAESRSEYRFQAKYGISMADYDKMYDDQNGCCAICGKSPEGQRYKKLYVDHDHRTNKVRGLLCMECNFGLGKFGDSIEVLEAALAYVRKHVVL